MTPDLLLHTALRYDWKTHGFIRCLSKGQYPQDALTIYARRLYLMVEDFVKQLAVVVSQTPAANLKFHLIQNLLEEEGIICDSDKLRLCPERRHPELAKKFTRAVGISDTELGTYPCPTPARLEKFLANDQWLAAAAYMTVGGEANIPALFNLIIPALRNQYHLPEEALVFFTEHVAVDAKHGAIGANLIAQAVNTPEQQQEALLGARSGATALWAFYQQVHREIQSSLLITV